MGEVIQEIIQVENFAEEQELDIILSRVKEDEYLLFHIFESELEKSYLNEIAYDIKYCTDQRIMEFYDPPNEKSTWILIHSFKDMKKFIRNNRYDYLCVITEKEKSLEEYSFIVEHTENFTLKNGKIIEALIFLKKGR